MDPVDSVDSVDITGFPRQLGPLLALFIFLPTAAFSSGYFLPGGGAQTLARAGAVVVSADDASLFWSNPALLSAQEGTRLFLSGGANFLDLSFLRYPVPEVSENFQPVSNSSSPAPFGEIGLSSDFGLRDFDFGLAFYTPAGTWNHYPEDGAQRYSEVRSQNMAWYVQAAAAWKPLEGMTLGAGLFLFSLRINYVYAVSAFSGIFGLPEDRDLDALVQSQAADYFIPGAVAGLWLSPGAWVAGLEGLEFGFSVSSGFSVDADGRLRIRLPDHLYYDGVTVDPSEPPVSVKLNFPWVVRLGVRYLFRQSFDVEVDAVWEGWSVLRDVRTILKQPTYYRNVPVMGDYRLNDTVSPRKFRDTWSLRTGLGYLLLEWLKVQAGFLWEQGATSDAYYSVTCPDSDKYGLGLGLSLILEPVRVDLGYLHLFQVARDISVEESRATQTNPSNPEDATIVGAGRYRSSIDMLGLGIIFQLDSLWRAK